MHEHKKTHMKQVVVLDTVTLIIPAILNCSSHKKDGGKTSVAFLNNNSQILIQKFDLFNLGILANTEEVISQ